MEYPGMMNKYNFNYNNNYMNNNYNNNSFNYNNNINYNNNFNNNNFNNNTYYNNNKFNNISSNNCNFNNNDYNNFKFNDYNFNNNNFNNNNFNNFNNNDFNNYNFNNNDFNNYNFNNNNFNNNYINDYNNNYINNGNNNFISEDNRKFSIMSYNVRCANDTLRNNVEGSVKIRSKYVINNILLYKPDSVGFQEVTINKNPKAESWYTLLSNGLKDYYIGVGQARDEKGKSEANPIFYNKNKFDLLEQGTKWLSPTPDIPYTEFGQPTDGCKRTLTYVILRNKMTGITYMHINTHLDYKFKQNRLKQIEVIKNFALQYKNKYPILLTGDFNSTKAKGDAVMYLLNIQGFCDSSKEATDCFHHWTFPAIGYGKNVYQNCVTRKTHKNGRSLEMQQCCGPECDKEHGKIIDYCLRCKDRLKFKKYKVVTDYNACGGISSDHYPIYIEGYFN